jgi:C-terminal processing protease CtpA/Prc
VFAAGPAIEPPRLSDGQVENLAVLARIWGFLKYHHPRVARGELHWDFELFRVLPAVLAARDAGERNSALLAWTRRIGEPGPCRRCAAAPREPRLLAELSWIHDRGTLGKGLSRYLEQTYRNRPAGNEQFFVAYGASGHGAEFRNEPGYESLKAPDAGYRLLALFRYWNMIEYWFPYRDSIGTLWTRSLTELIPKFVAATSREAYALALAELVARIDDSHAMLADDDVLPPRGPCQAPLDIRFVQGKAVVAGYAHPSKGPATLLRIGDVITAVDGMPVSRLLADRTPYYAASNEARKLDWAAYLLLRGPCTNVSLDIARGDERWTLDVTREPRDQLEFGLSRRHDRPGETFQWLEEGIAYLKVSTMRAADVAGYLERIRDSQGLVIDLRAYPAEPVLPAIGGHLVSEATDFAQLSSVDLRNPGTFVWSDRRAVEPRPPQFRGKVAILVDERTISQAEFTAMGLRAAPTAVVVGSTTAGADGNVTRIPLPGGFGTWISGTGIFNPDRSPTQRVGIIPDIVAAPTLAGIRDGRDEVLERAIRAIEESARP